MCCRTAWLTGNVRHSQMFAVCSFVCLLFCTFDVRGKAANEQSVPQKDSLQPVSGRWQVYGI